MEAELTHALDRCEAEVMAFIEPLEQAMREQVGGAVGIGQWYGGACRGLVYRGLAHRGLPGTGGTGASGRRVTGVQFHGNWHS